MMGTKPLPTTTLEVDADLRARADFRGIDDARGQAHYLLGMCEALLAEANREIVRLRGARWTPDWCESCLNDLRDLDVRDEECPICGADLREDDEPRDDPDAWSGGFAENH